MPIHIHNLHLEFPDGTRLFSGLNLQLQAQKYGLVGPNGIGKSSLLQLLMGEIPPTAGSISSEGRVLRYAQHRQEFTGQTVAQALGIAQKLAALAAITAGEGSPEDLLVLDDDWELEQRTADALVAQGLADIALDRNCDGLSGGELARLKQARLLLQRPDFLLLDEPTNHRDHEARKAFYHWVRTSPVGMLIVSHDRELLRQVDTILELSAHGLRSYGGSYDAYAEQKAAENATRQEQYRTAGKELKKKIQQQKKANEKQQKREVRGKQAGIRKNLPKEVINKLKGAAEATTSGLKAVHESRVLDAKAQFERKKAALPAWQRIRIDLSGTRVAAGKTVIALEGLNFAWQEGQPLWPEPLNFELRGPARIALTGRNGSGKTTLLQLIRGLQTPTAGQARVGVRQIGLLDQHLSMLDYDRTVWENMETYARGGLETHELRTRLHRFLFPAEALDRKAAALSGGERLRLALACLLATDNAPQLLLLDEPTNNLDFESLAQLTGALQAYEGALLVISHDQDFLQEIGITGKLQL